MRPNTGPIGIVQVAAKAGVSQATVSRALRNQPGVTPATRARVRAAAAELGYAPSASAAALARGRTNSIAVVSPWISRWFFATVLEGVHEVVAEHGYDMLLYPLDPSDGKETVRVDALGLHKRVDGVIGLSLPPDLRVGTLASVPLVTVGTSTAEIPGVRTDDRQVGYLATRHLLDLGHRRIAFLGLDPDDVYGYQVAADRYAGHCLALRQSGLIPDPDLVETTGFEVEAGEAGLDELLARAEWAPARLPTAVFAVSDEVAFGVIYAARHRGIRIPADLSVIGVDNHDLARLFDLTTVAQPVAEQGRRAAQMLFELIRVGRLLGPADVRMTPTIIERASTAPPSRPA